MKMTEQDIAKGEIKFPSNVVLVRMPEQQDIVSSSGLILNFNPDIQYAEGSGSHRADCAQTWGWVVKTPPRLFFNVFSPDLSMPWDTEMEILPGDKVWFNHIASLNSLNIETEKGIYKFVPYDDLIVAIRDNEVIPLNGNILLEEVKKEKASFLDFREDIDYHRGIVRYAGKPNKAYLSDVMDMTDVQPGDMITFTPNTYLYYLERASWNSNFGERLLVAQSRDIMALRRGETVKNNDKTSVK